MDFLFGLLTATAIVALFRLCGMQMGLLPQFVPGEAILWTKRTVVFCSALSLPSYNWSFSLPPLMEQAVFITDRRILHIFYLLRVFRMEFSQWFEQTETPDREDCILTVNTGRNRPAGAFLEIVSETSAATWLRSGRCRIRLYMRNPQAIYETIIEAMNERACL